LESDAFRLTVGEARHEAGPGTYVLIPRGTSLAIAAGPGGGQLLTLMVPGGLEHMFIELGTLPPNAIRDPDIRRTISDRFDAVPT
jgi:hypothetical protein